MTLDKIEEYLLHNTINDNLEVDLCEIECRYIHWFIKN